MCCVVYYWTSVTERAVLQPGSLILVPIAMRPYWNRDMSRCVYFTVSSILSISFVFTGLFSQQLLGRSIDLNRLLAQRLKSNLLKAIDLSITKFESCDICGIMVSDLSNKHTIIALPFRNWRFCLISIVSLIACWENMLCWTHSMLCFVRQTKLCRLFMVASHCMCFGSSFMTLYQTSVITQQLTGMSMHHVY